MLIRPRLTDHFGIGLPQAKVDFAIPFVSEDISLYVDPFLLWKSPSQQDNALHRDIIGAFDAAMGMAGNGQQDKAVDLLVIGSECDEVGLGNSASKRGKRIGRAKAQEIVETFQRIPNKSGRGLRHIEEIQLVVDGISKDRVSDFSCSFLKSFLIDFTIDQCDKYGIPTKDITVDHVYSTKKSEFISESVKLPVNPVDGRPIILTPKRWLRFVPWVNFEDYFSDYCPQDDSSHEAQTLGRVSVLNYNRENYGYVERYIADKERTAVDCVADPLFDPVPILSAKRHLARLRKLDSGNLNGADKTYEGIIEAILPSMFYPALDFAKSQSRTDSGSSIRDLVFYNTRDTPFLKTIYEKFGSQQIVFELKNVRSIEREHVDQLNRYLTDELGRFGVLVTRNPPSRAIRTRCVDLWSGQRKVILTITDEEIAQMVELFETKQRNPLDVINKAYFEFTQLLPN